MTTLNSTFHHDLTNYSRLPILVTGGAGYIGSHTCVALVEAGFTNIVIVDNFVNSSPEAIRRVEHICNSKARQTKSNTNTTAAQAQAQHQKIKLIHYDLDLALAENLNQLIQICKNHNFYACIHFAGLKAVGESIQKSLLYYQNNLISTTNLLQALHSTKSCRNIIFSSSATVYGTQAVSPIAETFPVGLGITNPYGRTKYFIEQILTDFAISHAKGKHNDSTGSSWNVVLLRYFNPIGAHESGLIGEDPQGIPNNLMPFLTRVAIAQTKKQTDVEYYNKYKQLSVFGNDYPTVDGTGVRDYIHVCDLAEGHVAALTNDLLAKQKKQSEQTDNVSVYNLGTGCGTSVLQLKAALENACGFEIPHVEVNRRPGDIATVYADCTLARQKLKWVSRRDVNTACIDSWRWQSKNPYGYKK